MVEKPVSAIGHMHSSLDMWTKQMEQQQCRENRKQGSLKLTMAPSFFFPLTEFRKSSMDCLAVIRLAPGSHESYSLL